MERPIPSTDLFGPAVDFPDISEEQTFFGIVRSLATYISSVISVPYTFEDLRVGQGQILLAPLTEHLGANCQQPELVAALLALKWHYGLDPDDRGIMQTRGWACEIIAWRYLSYLSESDLLDFLLYEVKSRKPSSRSRASTWFRSSSQAPNGGNSETSRLLASETSPELPSDVEEEDDDDNDPTARFIGLNALEIAAIAQAKKFLAQRSVQRIVGAIWRGEVVFWPALSVTTTKKPQRYNPRKSDPYSRLRVPRYQKLFEALFFASFLALYYAVLLERHPERITFLEFLLYIWIAAFAYDEFGELRDTGSLFYTADVWNLWDVCIVLVALIFLIIRVIGLAQDNPVLLDISFDILSLEALFLVPRLCSILSVLPYFGTLIPCLKEMTKDFVKFLAVVLILYLGFLTTFAMLARDTFSVRHISWILVYVFFGSSYMGFDTATKISPMLGPPLMMVFVALTNILLLTSLISLLSNSLTKVMDHAREEYLFQYSLFVLEASASRRLTYYLPPLNLIPLILFRPLRPFVHADTLRQLRITTLKVTHWPFVLVIWACESAPPPKYWLAWVSHKSIEDIDNNNNSHANNNNIFNPPRDHQQYLSRTDTESSILSSPNPNPNPNPNTPQTTITNKKSPKNWHLDLQPRQTHGRTTSYGHTLVHASAAIAAANGNTTPTKPRNTMHSIIINNQQSPTTNTTHIHAKPPSADADPNTSSQQGLSASETRDLKTSIANLEILVRQLLADRGGDRDGDRKRREDGSLGAAEGVGGDDDDEG